MKNNRKNRKLIQIKTRNFKRVSCLGGVCWDKNCEKVLFTIIETRKNNCVCFWNVHKHEIYKNKIVFTLSPIF